MTLKKAGNYTLNGVHDWANRRTADLNGRNASGNAEPGHPTLLCRNRIRNCKN